MLHPDPTSGMKQKSLPFEEISQLDPFNGYLGMECQPKMPNQLARPIVQSW